MVRPRAAVLLAEAAATTDEQKASGISWDSHQYVDQAPESLIRDDDLQGANQDMRRRFEENCRRAQNAICKAVSELDGAEFREARTACTHMSALEPTRLRANRMRCVLALPAAP